VTPKTLTLQLSRCPEEFVLAPKVALVVEFLPTRAAAGCAFV